MVPCPIKGHRESIWDAVVRLKCWECGLLGLPRVPLLISRKVFHLPFCDCTSESLFQINLNVYVTKIVCPIKLELERSSMQRTNMQTLDTFFVCVCQKRCRRLTVRTLAGQIEEGNGLLAKMETCLKGLQSFAAFPTASPINQRARSHQLQPSRVDMCRLSCDGLACIMAQLLV